MRRGARRRPWFSATSSLTSWGETAQRIHGLTPLGCVLCLLSSLDRTVRVTSWATSPDEWTRRSLARALSAPFEALGVRSVLEHLGEDPSPEVRRLARAAAVRRGAPFGSRGRC